MVWREPKDHLNDYYFSMNNTKGIEKKNRQNISYSSISSAIRPVLYSGEFPPPVYNDFVSFKDEIEFEDVRMEYEYKKNRRRICRLFY